MNGLVPHIIFRNVIRHHALGVISQLGIKYITTHQCIDSSKWHTVFKVISTEPGAPGGAVS